MSAKCAVYRIINLVNGGVYIGSSVQPEIRWHQHQQCRGDYPLYRAFKKYGIASFSFKVESWHDTEQEGQAKEQSRIQEVRSQTSKCYNATFGGEGLPGGVPVSAETRAKISAAQVGSIRTEEQKRKISEKLKGRVVSEETGAKISAAKIGVRRTPEQRQRMSDACKGRKLSEETKRKIGDKSKQTPRTEEWKEKIRKSHQGKTMSEEARQAMRDGWARRKDRLTEEGAV